MKKKFNLISILGLVVTLNSTLALSETIKERPFKIVAKNSVRMLENSSVINLQAGEMIESNQVNYNNVTCWLMLNKEFNKDQKILDKNDLLLLRLSNRSVSPAFIDENGIDTNKFRYLEYEFKVIGSAKISKLKCISGYNKGINEALSFEELAKTINGEKLYIKN